MPRANQIAEISAAAPRALDHLVGQSQVVELLRIALAAYWNDHAAGLRPQFGPVLLEGGPGLGKTLLAQVVARELGGNLREVLGQTLCMGGDDLNELLLEATDDTVLFFEEAQL